jgi:hypothetical protein
MIDVKLSRDELNVLLFALNNMSHSDEAIYEQKGLSMSALYNKIYSFWETSPLTNSPNYPTLLE